MDAHRGGRSALADLAARSRLPPLFSAGRVRAPAFSPLGEYPVVDGPGVLAVDCHGLSLPLVAHAAAGGFRGRWADSRIRPTRSPSIGQSSVEADVARHTGSDGGDGVCR